MSNIFKKIKISWTYPTQPTSLQIGTVKIYRGTSEFTLDNVLSQVELVSQEYDPTFTSFSDDFELEYDVTYYYMIIVYGDIDSSISAATGLYSTKIEAPVQTPTISCDGATNTSGCMSWEEGVIDLEVNGVKVLSNVSKTDLETYLFNNGDIENDLTLGCGCRDGYYRSVHVPYSRYEQGQTLFLPVSLKPNGQSITTPFTVQGTTQGDRADFITNTLNSQLEPYGLHCVYGLFATDSIDLGVTYNRSKFSYKDTEFYILDEGNTFTSEEITRGLPPYSCFMVS